MTTAQTATLGLAQREPALVYGGGLTGVSLVINAIVGLGIPLSDTTKIGIILVVSVVGPLVGMWLTRAMVISPATLAAIGPDAKAVLTHLQGLRTEVIRSEAAKITPPTDPTLGSDGDSR